jgi:hypothetical protein
VRLGTAILLLARLDARPGWTVVVAHRGDSRDGLHWSGQVRPLR